MVYSYNDLNITVLNDHGRIKVSKNGVQAGISRVYVKVFAKNHSGTSSFYRDGYTDAAGGFNYFDVKTARISNISQFAVYVDSPELGKSPLTPGCLMMNIDPPKGEVKAQEKVALVSKAMKSKQREMAKKRYVSSKYEFAEEEMGGLFD